MLEDHLHFSFACRSSLWSSVHLTRKIRGKHYIHAHNVLRETFGHSIFDLPSSKLDNCAPVALVCQYGIYLHLSEKSVIESLGLTGGGTQWFNSEHLLKSSDKRIPTQRNIEALISCNLEIETIPVKHWGKCFGVCIEDKTENWKIV